MHAVRMIYFHGGCWSMSEKTERYGKWTARVEEQEQSGQTQKKYCIERDVVLSQFTYYRCVLKRRVPSQPQPTAVLTPITIKSTKKVSESQINITLPNGFRCELSAGTEVSYVKRLMEVLLSC